MKKTRHFIFVLLISILTISFSTQTVVASASPIQDAEIAAVVPPTKIWWDVVLDENQGSYYFFTVYRPDRVYRGYLGRDWENSIGAKHTYRGYLYREGHPYPIPARNEVYDD